MKHRANRLMVLFFLGVIVLAACSSQGQTVAKGGLYPTYTFYPTYTAYPTYTPNAFCLLKPSVTLSPEVAISGLGLGNPESKVQVVEFADFQCPFCQRYFQYTEPTILQQYVETNLIYYTYSPMAFLGQESIDAANAAFCANDQGEFWEYRAYLYTNLSGENNGSYAQEKLNAFAADLGLDTIQFKDCLTTAIHQSDLEEALAFATNEGVAFTPAFLVNGEVVKASDLASAIDKALVDN
jgi:protein-disulfide isomerase